MIRVRRIRGTSQEIDEAALRLRRKLTPAERMLWRLLRGCQLAGVKFRRQHPVGQFVLDFYCPSCRLAIEIDGDSHIGREAHDSLRTQTIESYGYRVLRFQNEDVLYHLDIVLSQIRQALEQQSPL